MRRIFKKVKIKKAQPRATGWILTKLDEIKVNIATLEEVDIVNKVSDEDINTIRAQIKEIQDFIGSKDDPSIDYSSIVVELSELGTRLIELNSRITTAELEITSLQTQVDTVEGIANGNTGAIELLDERLVSNEAKDTQQDVRLSIIEDELQVVGFDYSAMTDSGSVGTTTAIITPTIVKDFQTELATNTINGSSQLTTTSNVKSIIKFGYELTAEQVSEALVDFTIELYNLTTGTVVDTSTHTMDFAGSTTFETLGQTLIGSFEAGQQFQIRVKTNVGSVNITKAKGIFEINSNSGGLDIVYDYNVVSTSVWGQANTKEDFKAVYDRIVSNEASITTNSNNITSLQAEDVAINAKLDQIYNQIEVD